MTITIKAYKHIQDGNQLQRTGNAGDPYSQMAFVEILNILLTAGHIVDVNRFLINRNANPRFGSLSGYFRWSFSDNHFTLWQRVEYNSPLCFSRRIFSIHFGMLASRDRKRDNTVMN